MFRLYADENFPLLVILKLRGLGCDVLTMTEVKRANLKITDQEVLARASELERIVLTLKRKHFKTLHLSRPHCGIAICTFDLDFDRQAKRIHDALLSKDDCYRKLISVNRP